MPDKTDSFFIVLPPSFIIYQIIIVDNLHEIKQKNNPEIVIFTGIVFSAGKIFPDGIMPSEQNHIFHSACQDKSLTFYTYIANLKVNLCLAREFYLSSGGHMHLRKPDSVFLIIFSLICLFPVSAQQHSAQQVITQEELAASVPELNDFHAVIYPLWHDAFPKKDYALIKTLLPKVDSLSSRLCAAELPGILRDKQAAWDKNISQLKSTIEALHVAAGKSDQEGMLARTEQLHSNFEMLVRTIRPMVKELDAFHQELYKLYHYHMPAYELDKIREVTAAMQEKMNALKQAQLPSRLAGKKEQFDKAVADLDTAVTKLAKKVKKDNKKGIAKIVETVHSAYQRVESLFD